MPRAQLIRLREGTAAEWKAANPLLQQGEPGQETDTGFVKVGDGVTLWNDLHPDDFSFGATEMFSAAAMVTTNSFPRLSFPPGVTTTAFAGGFNFPHGYPACDLHIAWTNEGAGVGDVVWAWNIRQVNPGQTPAGGTLIATGFGTFAAPAANAEGLTILDAEVVPAAFGPLGFVLGLEIARLGASDVFPNAVGLVGAGFKRVVP